MTSILKFSTSKDKGFVRKPILTPHLQYRVIKNHQILLISEFFNTLLSGEIYCALIPVLNGTHTIEELPGLLPDEFSEQTVMQSIYSLSARGFIVSSEFTLEESQVAYWSALGASPCWVQQQLSNKNVSVEGSDGLKEQIINSGIQVVEKNPTLRVVECNHYLDSKLSAINTIQLQKREPWVLVRTTGIETMIGPIFHSKEDKPCWDCLTNRIRCHKEVHEFIRNVKGDQEAFYPKSTNEYFQKPLQAFAAQEIQKWLVLEDNSKISNKVICFDTMHGEISHHTVSKRPQCMVCGSKEFWDPSRKPKPIILHSSGKPVGNSSGGRVVSPEITIARYKHLISPVSGVVSWLKRTTKETDECLHVHWAGSNLALKINSLSSLRRSLRSKSAGKGSSSKQSEVSALCEAVERYSGSYFGDEIRMSASYTDFQSDESAIHPNSVQRFSENQLQQAEIINSQGHPYNYVPQPLDPDSIHDWTPVWSFTQNRQRYLPTSMLYFMPPEFRSPQDFAADSNGCASGNTMEEAIVQGFYELVERDAFAIWWYNELRFPQVDLPSFDNEFLNQVVRFYKEHKRELWVLDITSDFCIPTYVAVSRRADHKTEQIIYSAGAHTNEVTAVTRAVCELNQCFTWLPRDKKDRKPMIDDPMINNWWNTAKLDDHKWLQPKGIATYNNNHKSGKFSDLKEEVEFCQNLVENLGMEFLVLDQTRPDIKLPVVRVIVPGMRHFWSRLAGGRLYDVPVKQGWFERPLTEAELNQTPVLC